MSAGFKLTPGAARIRLWSFFCLLIMIIGSVGLDQATKAQSQQTLMIWNDPSDPTLYQGQRYPIGALGAFGEEAGAPYVYFGFNYVRNLGAAWGALSGLPSAIRIPFFYAVTIFAVIIIGLYLRSTPPHHRLATFALTLILSGALGNFVDRIRYGYVIDWIDVRWNLLGWQYDFPNFNIADSAITVGVSLLLIDMLILEAIRQKKGDRLGVR
jgi:signal peptidase II